MRIYLRLALLALLVALLLAACGDNPTNTPAPAATTVATTTAAATVAPKPTTAAVTTTAAATSGASTGSDQIPPYTGGTILTVPDAFKTQFAGQVASTLKNPDVAALATPDSADKIKAFYTDYLTKNGWQDASSLLGSAASQYKALEQAGGFFLVYSKGTRVFMVLGLPSAAAPGIGFTETIPAGSTLVLGFTGEAVTSGVTGTSSSASGPTLGGVPAYPGATVLTLPPEATASFNTAVGAAAKNAQIGAFTTPDGVSKVKAFYTDWFSKNGWNDLSSALGSSGAQFEQMGGFFSLYAKDKKVFVVLGLPGSAAAGFGASGANVPATGSLVLGGVGDAP